MDHDFKKLKTPILARSKAETFDVACREWDLVGIEVSEELDNCPCGQQIKEHCFIQNRVTGHKTFVGNVCVNRFMGISTSTLFDGLRRVKDDPLARPNEALINHALSRGYIYGEKEHTFLTGIRRKRILSTKQRDWSLKINRRIVNSIVVKKRSLIGD
jgi:hypothetical protein